LIIHIFLVIGDRNMSFEPLAEEGFEGIIVLGETVLEIIKQVGKAVVETISEVAQGVVNGGPPR